MGDPYSVLGVTRSSSDSEIKSAYRKLCRKYHPDANVNNPDAAKCEERFKEIQNAYKIIMDERKNGFSSSAQYGGYGSTQNEYRSENDIHMQAALNFIQNRRFREAINVLSQINERDAKWYYFNAIANMGIGNREAALSSAETAASMEPGNFEYSKFAQQLRNGDFTSGYGQSASQWYQTTQQSYGYNPSSYSDFCGRMCLYNVICNCCCTPFC